MRRPLLAILVFLSLPALGERIQELSVELWIQDDGYVFITEGIVVFFDLCRHGIIREIPFFRLPTGERYKLRIAVEEVLADGAPVPVRLSTEEGNLVLRIGDPNPLVSGPVVYTIRYRAARALRPYGEEVERLEFAAAERHFEELLPYALALGLTEVWTRKFAGLLRRPPDWYEGRFPTFTPEKLPFRLLAFQRAAQAAAKTSSRSASHKGWRGGSGFGGGFSGGGMGGGGGRAW